MHSFDFMDNFTFGVQVINDEFKYIYLNKILLSEIKMKSDQIVGRKMQDVFPGIENSQIYHAIQGCLSNGEAQKITNEFTLPNGKTTYYELNLQYIPQGVIIFSNDITDSKLGKILLEESKIRLEKKIQERTVELEKQKSRAEAALKVKSDFLAAMSHEIRTPMNGVIGMAELLSYTNLSDEQQEYVDSLLSSSDLLLNIINDILDFSKLEAGKIELINEDIDIRNCLSECSKMFQFKTADKRQELTQLISNKVPGFIITDEKRLKQIIINILGNAIKYTPEKGEIHLELNVIEPNGDPYLCFSIKDTGIGVPKNKQNELFKPFTQVDSSTTKNYEGTGLGLAISKNIIELMKGSIWFESEENIGSTFYFNIPLIQSKNQNPVYLRSNHEFLEGKQCVLIDDNPTNLKVFKNILHNWKINSKDFLNPEEGLQDILTTKPDFVLLDYNMPKKSGVDIAKEIRKFHKKEIIIFLCTSYDSDELRNNKSLFNHILTKPIRHKVLFETLCNTFTENNSISKIPKKLTLNLRNKYVILIVEDNPVNQNLVKRILNKMQIETDIANNGEIAVRMNSEKKYDLIFMDIHMPKMSGFEAIKIIQKQNQNLPPIVIMSADVFKTQDYNSLNIYDHILKPIKVSDLESLFKKLGFE
ncbi:MAG: response regulator [Leptospiraceae bacterium]|nr:response regulator [Leptospiraceae bacterium]